MENGIYVKTITLNYLEYLEMMEKINKAKAKLTELYNKKDINKEIKKEIEDFMIKENYFM